MDRGRGRGLIWLLLPLFITACQSPQPPPLTIATAASLRYVAEAIVADFEKETGIDCELVVGATGALTAQIMAGAPYDVLLSADDRYPAALARAGRTAGPAQIFAYGSLVLWSMDTLATLSLDSMRENDRLAIANPAIAPYGRLADSLLRLRPDFLTDLETKLVFGESIAQVNQFVTTGAVKYGLTAKSVVEYLAPNGHWVDFGAGEIGQTVVVLKSNNLDKSKAFVAYLINRVGL